MTQPERANEPAQVGEQSLAYQVVARRFRPKTFAEVVGQADTVRALAAALDSGKVPHAFLFAGSRGVGKTTIARILARALNCTRGISSQPCGTCERCRAILADSDPDVIEIDAASHNGVDDIRAMRERAGYAPMRGGRKVFILDEVHMLSRAAFNAFLKVLEEPPPQVSFVLATTEVHKVPETIRSRCQVHLFRRVDEAAIEERLAQICQREGVEVGPGILAEIGRSSRGGMRDAESALERVMPLLRQAGADFDLQAYREFVGRVGLERVAEVVAALAGGDPVAAIEFANEVFAAGIDERECLGEVLEVLRSALHLSVHGPASLLVSHQGQLRERIAGIADRCSLDAIEAMVQIVILGRDRIRRFDDRQLLLELTLLRLARAAELPRLGDLLQELQAPGEVAARAAPARAAAPLPSGSSLRAASAPQGRPAEASAAPSDAATPEAALRTALAERFPTLHDSLRTAAFSLGDAGLVIRVGSVKRLERDRLGSEGFRAEAAVVYRQILGKPGAVRVVFGGEPAPRSGELPRAPQPAPEERPAGDRRQGGRREPASEAPPETPSGRPGELAEKVRKRFDGLFVQEDRTAEGAGPAP